MSSNFLFKRILNVTFLSPLVVKMSTNVASGNGLVVVTHVYREQDLKGDAPPNVAVPPSLLGNGRQRAVPPQNGVTHPFVAQFIHLLEPVMRDQTTVGVSLSPVSTLVQMYSKSTQPISNWQLQNS